MADKISINKKDTSNTNDLILKQRIKLLTSDYNNNPNLIAVINVNQEFVFANNALLNAFQYSFQDLKDKKISDLYSSTSSQIDISQALSQAEKSYWSEEVICYRKDGKTFNSKLRIILIKNSNDVLCGYELNAANIENVKLNFNKLFDFLLKLEKSYHSFPDLLIIVNEKRDIIEFKYFDIESDYFVLKPEENTKLEDVMPLHIVEEIESTINKIKSGPQIIHHEFPFIINNNKKIFVAEITRNENHQFSINLRDITKIKQEKRDLKNADDGFPFTTGDSVNKAGMRILNENIKGDFVKTKDGRLLSLEESYSPLIDENNRVIGFIAREKIVDAGDQPEEKLVGAYKKFNAIWEKSFDGLRLTDSRGNIVSVNSAFCTMFEMEREQLLGKPFTVIYQQDESDNERKMNKYIQNFESGSYNFQRYSKSVLYNGKSLFLFENYSYIQLTSAEPLVLGIFRDVTEIKKTQEELDRTKELATIGKMSSYLSHEIKNPLASIRNYVDLLLSNKEMPENTKPILNILQDSLGNLSKLLNDVLLFSSNIKLIKIDINVYDLVEKVRELLLPKINNKNIQFKNNLTRSVIRGDYVRLQSVFFNMIENSIDAVANGGVIELNDSVVAENYLVHIIDNGCGITEQDKVFEAFHSEKRGGTGLGLGIAKKIMEMHEGNITLIKSKPGGTVFELQFPSYNKG